MRRIRKSIHNLASALASSFSANAGQYLAGFSFFWHFGQTSVFAFFASLQYLSFYKSASNSRAKRKDRHVSLKHISKQINANTHITHRSIFCFVLYNFCSISVCCTWCTSNRCALTCVGWNFGIVCHWGIDGGFPLYLPLIGPQLSFSLFCISLCHLSQATWFSLSENRIEYFKVVAENLLHWMLHFVDVQPSLRDDVIRVLHTCNILHHRYTSYEYTVQGTFFLGRICAWTKSQ